jgi:alkanesulfonate monooxygenase SsuD/methylene tetrahydromethanopterin reductase-like flavin-dependent oxidoreductase (luciferase family)
MDFGLFVVAQHRSGSMADHVDRHLEQVRAARDSGFAAVYANHHYFSNPFQQLHPMPFLARMAAETGEMRLGVGILLTALLNPVDVCEQVTTLDAITHGRFIFGVGLGYRDVEYEAFGIDRTKRVKIFEEGLALMRRLWTEPIVSHEDERTVLREVTWPTPPVQRPHPPIWIAANNDPAIRRAARLGDAWMINPHTRLEVLVRQMEVYREALDAAAKPFPAVVPIIKDVYLGATREEAVRDARPFLEAKYRTYVEWGQNEALPTDDSIDVPFEALRDDRFILGTTDDLIEALEKHEKGLGVNHVVFRLQWSGPEHSTPQDKVLNAIRLIGDKVVPHFAKRSPAGGVRTIPLPALGGTPH